MKIYQVNSVSVTKQSETPLTLIIHAIGTASSTGWTNPALDGSGDANPGDAIFEYSFAAAPPAGIALQVLTPLSATLVVTPERSVDAVIVYARTNSITVHATEFLTPGRAVPHQLTTLVVGEEDPTTLRVGEEGMPTLPLGEGHPTTMIFGEEGPATILRGENPTTLRLGEEGFSTMRVGEEGPTTDPRLDDPIDPTGGGLGGPFGAI